MNKKKISFQMNVGTSSILLVFIILSLVSFASLSLSSAVADQKLTQKGLAKNEAYYQAQNLAQLRLCEIDSMLEEEYQKSESEQEYFKTVGDSISFQVTISDTQYLEVVLAPLYPKEASDSFYEILSWKEYTQRIDSEEVNKLKTLF